MTWLKMFGDNYHQEVDREGRYFDNLRELAENEYADPGEEFFLDVELVPATGYYGEDRSILVREGVSTLGILPKEDIDTWWKLLCALHDANEEATVPARIWTCRDWDDFYASVRLDLPTIEEAEEEVESLNLTKKNREAWKNFSNFVEEYWDPRWVEAHGITEDQVQAHRERAHRSYEELKERRRLEEEQNNNASDQDEQPAVPVHTGQPPAAAEVNPYGRKQEVRRSKPKTQSKQKLKTAAPAPTPAPQVDWANLLHPDGTERATPWQRGYVRSKVNKFYPGSEWMPRIDFATVGQCESILRHFDEDPAPLHETGRGSMALWWVFMVVIGFFFVVMAFVPPGGTVLFLLWVGVIAHHFITRARLKPPFDKQQ